MTPSASRLLLPSALIILFLAFCRHAEAGPPPAGHPEVPGSGEDLAVDTYKKTGKAPYIYDSGLVRIPFGHGQPTVVTALGRITDIELEPGEKVWKASLGDVSSWEIAVIKAGSPKTPTRHVVIKPLKEGLFTNMLIYTDRRTYFMNLESTKSRYVLQIRFWYPDDLVQSFESMRAAAGEEGQKENDRILAKLDRPVVPRFGYSLVGSVFWKPRQVYDDGTRTYILMPKSVATSQHLPVFEVVDSDGQTEIENYAVKGNVFVVPRIFKKGVLFWNVGHRKEQVLIVHGQSGDSSWSGGGVP
uniref:Putative conjugal transfer protein (TrbG) n=1 Tax=Leptospirillum ferrodiazotrophum TaxID=412449 RepID=C6HTW9_9BACT|nr:MAG: putative conjugal transfer protein (TrbG) [Leptospirillum ferrodiazotrophum]